jgi:radical SAM protein with 4Fe4S-binding SPASM domain
MNWSFYLKTTETCNLNCKHCFTNGINGAKIYWNYREVSDWIKRFIKEKATNSDTIHCEFHGGEPFLVDIEEMQYVYDECNSLHENISWGATTNLVYKLKDEQIDFIKGPLGKRIGTSWDPKIRFDNEKQTELWYNNVKRLLKEGIVIRLFISVTQDTINIDPIHLLAWIKELGVQEVSFERLTKNGSANKNLEIFPSNVDQDQWFLKMHRQSELYNSRNWFENHFLETIYEKFEKNFSKSGTFCRDCEEKLFTLNADGTISGCPNSAPEKVFGHINQNIKELMSNPIRIETMACEKNRNDLCYSCEVFQYCGGDCHQLEWQEHICGAPKSLMKFLNTNTKKIWKIHQTT